jgi:hypothetical protein
VLFQALGLVPDERDAKVIEASVTWNYTTFLNIAFLGAVRRSRRAVPAHRRPQMLRMMNAPAATHPDANAEDKEVASMEDEMKDDGYTCPMHPEVRGGPEDRCPKCGMLLERRDDSTRS